MKNEDLQQIYKSLCFPEKKLKSIKFKRFVRQMNSDIDFTEIDILLSQLHNNYTEKKLSCSSFLFVMNFLVQTGQLTLDLISERFEERLSHQEE